MTNLNDLIYVCKEVFDENSEPTKNEIEEQAFRLGIDPVKESHLLSIAKQCLLEPLPSNWFPCYIERENKYFYYNKLSKTSQWEHPLDKHYRQIVEKIRSEDSSTGQDISLNIILDEDISLDTMYHSKHDNYEKKALTEKRTVRFKTPIEESLDFDHSDDNMKFLGPIKLNTPYNSTPSTLQNLPQFATTSSIDTRNIGSRSVFSKYNILPSKDELSRKSDFSENIKRTNGSPTTSVNYSTGLENLRKIDITLTESSDRSESSSSEIHSENLNNYNEGNDVKEKDNVITTVRLNKRYDKNYIPEDQKSASENLNEFQPREITKLYNVKKDDLVSDSGNSTAKDSNIIQSSIATNSFSVTKSKMAEIAQRFPLNQSTNERQPIKPTEGDEGILDIKSNSVQSRFELANNLNDKKQMLLDTAHIKVMIENHCDTIKTKMEDTINMKENKFRDEFIKKIEDVIHEQNNNFEKRIEARHNDLFNKNELELKNLIQNVQDKSEKSLIDEEKVQNILSNTEQTCANNLNKFKIELENYAESIKNKIQTELNIISNELKKDFCTNSEKTSDSWNQILESYKHAELEKVKNIFEKATENIKRDTDVEIHRFNLEFKEKLKVVSEDKLNNATEQLEAVIREEIDLVKKRVSENYHNERNIIISNHKPQSKSCIDDSERLNSEYQSVDVTRVNYSDLRKKIQYCSNELSDALKLVNEVSPATEYTTERCTNSHSNKCTVSCQTENMMLHPKSRLKEYTFPEYSNMPVFNSLYGVNTKYDNYWNQTKMSEDLCSNYMTTYSQILNPLDILNQEELKVNAAEQNICHLIDTFNTKKPSNVYHIPNNANVFQHKYTNSYLTLSPKNIAYNRTKQLREWLHQTDLKNKNLF